MKKNKEDDQQEDNFSTQNFSKADGDDRSNSPLINKQDFPPVKLEDGCIYTGEWNGKMREGRGILDWTDGSRYVGQWKNDKANGRGKLVHADGDIYDGQWVDDLASGYGVYT